MWRGLPFWLAEFHTALSTWMPPSHSPLSTRPWLAQFWLPVHNSCRSSLCLFSSSPAWSVTAPRFVGMDSPSTCAPLNPIWPTVGIQALLLATLPAGQAPGLPSAWLPLQPGYSPHTHLSSFSHLTGLEECAYKSVFICWHPWTFCTKRFHSIPFHFVSPETKWSQRQA